MATFTLEDVQQKTYKSRDAWWTVLLVDPLAARLVLLTANRTSITPNQLTTAALFLGLGAAGCFAMASWPWLLLGAVLYHLAFVLDCMDGKVARLKGTGSVFGAWLDYIFDRVRVLACAIALMGGQYAATGNVAYVWTALAVVFLDMLRYLDALEIYKVRSNMRKQLHQAHRTATEAELAVREANGELEDETAAMRADMAKMDDLLDNADAQQVVENAPQPAADLHQGFHTRFPWYAKLRDLFRGRRIRTHLVSGIEFQMAVFIVAPVLAAVVHGAIIPVTVLAAIGLLFFEFVIIYKFYLSSRDFSRQLDRLQKEADRWATRA